MLLRRDLTKLVAPADREHPVYAEKSGAQTVGGLSDSPIHLILDRGRALGFWEYDPDQAQIAWMTFGAPPEGLAAEIVRTETFARAQLGDVRSLSPDTPASRAPKLAWL